MRHDLLLEKVAGRVSDADVLHLLKMMLKASGKKGVPQGGVISPLLSNLYLNEVDKMLERAKETTRNGSQVPCQYARYADDLVILVDPFRDMTGCKGGGTTTPRGIGQTPRRDQRREESNRRPGKRESFGFLGFEFRRVRSRKGSGDPTTLPSRRSGRRCWPSSGRSSDVHQPVGGWWHSSTRSCVAG